ncbi:MAG: NAD(P)-dependent oxidoreductase [Acidimicrobiales bacterium]|nr:NAD(P)-dependent oxidoreductase [Acidimicrobiales bacterium]
MRAVGVLGLGNMGSALAGRLLRRFKVIAHDPDPRCAARAAAMGVEVLGSLDAVVAGVDTVVLSLPRPAVSLEIVKRLSGLWGPGGAVIETSTITPEDAREAAAICHERGIAYVDAAILSGVKSVEEGTTSLLIGGDPASTPTIQPVLDALTSHQRHLGGVGTGMAAKVVNNAVAHAVYVVLGEAVAMGASAGLSLATVVELLSDPEAGLLRPLTHRIGERLRDGNFDGGMAVEAARKDSELALRFAQFAGIPLFAIQAAHSVYEIAVAQGMARSDYSVIATLWDTWMAAEH